MSFHFTKTGEKIKRPPSHSPRVPGGGGGCAMREDEVQSQDQVMREKGDKCDQFLFRKDGEGANFTLHARNVVTHGVRGGGGDSNITRE